MVRTFKLYFSLSFNILSVVINIFCSELAVFTIADSRINKAVSLPITDNISILTAESVAILAGLAVSTRENFHRILIVSDSKTAVDKFNALKDGAYNKHVAARIGTTPLERRIWTEIGKLATSPCLS